MSLVPFDVENFYPTPKIRIENPVPTHYKVGDIVKVLIGPATEKFGAVVVEKNGNYRDYEPYCSAESIGVAVMEKRDFHPDLARIVEQLSGPSSLIHTVVRWFDNPEQLDLVMRAKTK